MAQSKLWTIGYENVGVPEFVAALKEVKIKTLVDVREIANSRRAGYVHMKPLGTPKAGREAARKGDSKTMRRIFEAKLVEPESQLALAETADLAKKGRVCIMCLEHDWRDCHRAIVAEHLDAFGLKPAHLSPGPPR